MEGREGKGGGALKSEKRIKFIKERKKNYMRSHTFLMGLF